jgi:murein DD-endopeptidase MepM/ murein hydrolase activator NlpD
MDENNDPNKLTGYIGNSLKNIIVKAILKNFPVSITIISIFTLIFLVIVIIGGMFESVSFIKIGMTKEESEAFKKDTLGFFNPEKMKAYKAIENESYIQNTKVRESVTIINDEGKREYEQEADFKIGDNTIEHKLHWQLLASIDTLSGYAEKNTDNTVEQMARKYLMPEYEFSFKDKNNRLYDFKYYKTSTEINKQEIKIDGQIVIKTTKTIIKTPQPYINKVNTAYFNIEYEYENTIISEENIYNGDTTITRKIEGYVIKNIKKEPNNRIEEFLNQKEFKRKLSYKNLEEIYDFGAQFPESIEFCSTMMEYLSVNPDINIAVRNYSGKEGTHIVTEDNKQFRIPIKFKDEKGENKVAISSSFGPREFFIGGVIRKDFHRGLDFAVPSGTPIVASANGKVINSKNYDTYGNYVELEHENGYRTVYAHNSRLMVKVGDKVKRGDIIAISGNTGLSNGPHLHFEIKYNNNIMDPYPKLNLKE